MFDTRELSLKIFTNDYDIDVIVAVDGNWERVAEVDVGEELQMLVELMVVVVFRVDAFLGNHDAQQNTLVLVENPPIGDVLESVVIDDIELNRDVCGFKHFHHAF